MLLKFLVFEFWQFNCNVFGVALFKFKLFGILWASWIWIYISLPGFKKLSATIALNILCMPFFFPSPFSIPIMQIMFLFSVFYNCYRRFLLFHSFFSLLLCLSNSQHPVLQVANSLFCMFKSTFEALYWILQFTYCSFQLQDFCFVLFCFFDSFYFLVKLLILFVHCFPNSFSYNLIVCQDSCAGSCKPLPTSLSVTFPLVQDQSRNSHKATSVLRMVIPPPKALGSLFPLG